MSDPAQIEAAALAWDEGASYQWEHDDERATNDSARNPYRAALTAAAQEQPVCAHTYIVQEDGWRECSKCAHRYQRFDPQPAPEADERPDWFVSTSESERVLAEERAALAEADEREALYQAITRTPVGTASDDWPTFLRDQVGRNLSTSLAAQGFRRSQPAPRTGWTISNLPPGEYHLSVRAEGPPILTCGPCNSETGGSTRRKVK